jgi:hypothetical protein
VNGPTELSSRPFLMLLTTIHTSEILCTGRQMLGQQDGCHFMLTTIIQWLVCHSLTLLLSLLVKFSNWYHIKEMPALQAVLSNINSHPIYLTWKKNFVTVLKAYISIKKCYGLQASHLYDNMTTVRYFLMKQYDWNRFFYYGLFIITELVWCKSEPKTKFQGSNNFLNTININWL